MIGSGLRIAWRNLGRNVRRTALTLGAIAIAQCAVLQMDGLMNGIVDSTLESVTGPLMGHVQIHEPSWREERAPDLVIEDVEATLAAVRGTEGVEAAYARIYAPALIAREVAVGVHGAPHDPRTVAHWIEAIRPLAQYMRRVDIV